MGRILKNGVEYGVGGADLLNLIYPVGSIYISTSSTFNPQTVWGGKWKKTADGRCLIGASTAYPLGSTGGSENHAHSSNDMYARIGPYGTGFTLNILHTPAWTSDWTYQVSKATQENKQNEYATRVFGQTTESSNMQPYLAVYIWERIA
nr:MAG TPA: baseplate protein [Caudoviricetes sp.]